MTGKWMRGASVAMSMLASGCANTDYAAFVTKTSLSIVDVDTQPAEASIAYGRTEGYVGPRLEDGTVYPVVGFINAEGQGLSRETRQVFAGGAAAVIVLKGEAQRTRQVAKGACSDDRKNPPLLFATGTSLGVRVGFAEGSLLPNSANLGWRRKEAALVPVSLDCQPSVLATVDSDAGARAADKEPKTSLGVTQYFATGMAAEVLAKDPRIQGIFKDSSVEALGAVAAFKDRERVQLRSTVDTLGCVAQVPDSEFDKVVADADDLGLLPEGSSAMLADTTAGAPRRAKYARLIALQAGAGPDKNPDERTMLLKVHQKRVCKLGKSN